MCESGPWEPALDYEAIPLRVHSLLLAPMPEHLQPVANYLLAECLHSIPVSRYSMILVALLPDQWQRSDRTFQEFVLKLILQSYSPAKIKILLQSLNLPCSPEQINERAHL